MVVAAETIILCIVFFLLCYIGTGTDEKNLKSYSSYPDEVRVKINNIAKYQGKFNKNNRFIMFILNLLIFSIILFLLGLFIKKDNFFYNFLYLSIMGQGLNIFDLLVIDLLWWRNTKRIRLSKIPEKKLYQNPKKHIEAFFRGLVMFLLIAVIDGYILTLF